MSLVHWQYFDLPCSSKQAAVKTGLPAELALILFAKLQAPCGIGHKDSRAIRQIKPRRSIIPPLSDAAVASVAVTADEPENQKLIFGIAPLTWQKIIPLGFMFFCILFNYTILRDTKVRTGGSQALRYIILSAYNECHTEGSIYRSRLSRECVLCMLRKGLKAIQRYSECRVDKYTTSLPEVRAGSLA